MPAHNSPPPLLLLVAKEPRELIFEKRGATAGFFSYREPLLKIRARKTPPERAAKEGLRDKRRELCAPDADEIARGISAVIV